MSPSSSVLFKVKTRAGRDKVGGASALQHCHCLSFSKNARQRQDRTRRSAVVSYGAIIICACQGMDKDRTGQGGRWRCLMAPSSSILFKKRQGQDDEAGIGGALRRCHRPCSSRKDKDRMRQGGQLWCLKAPSSSVLFKGKMMRRAAAVPCSAIIICPSQG